MSCLVDACWFCLRRWPCLESRFSLWLYFLHFLSKQVFRDFCRSIGVTSIRSVRLTHDLCIIAPSSLSSLSLPATPCLSLVFQFSSSSLSPSIHSSSLPSFPLTSLRQYEEKQLKGQQERAQRRLEFANQESRLQNQLAYERQRDTMGMCSHESLCVMSSTSCHRVVLLGSEYIEALLEWLKCMSCSQVCAIFILHITLTTTCGVEGCSCLCYCHTNQAHDFMCMNEFARVVRQATCIKPGMETCSVCKEGSQLFEAGCF